MNFIHRCMVRLQPWLHCYSSVVEHLTKDQSVIGSNPIGNYLFTVAVKNVRKNTSQTSAISLKKNQDVLSRCLRERLGRSESCSWIKWNSNFIKQKIARTGSGFLRKQHDASVTRLKIPSRNANRLWRFCTFSL